MVVAALEMVFFSFLCILGWGAVAKGEAWAVMKLSQLVESFGSTRPRFGLI